MSFQERMSTSWVQEPTFIEEAIALSEANYTFDPSKSKPLMNTLNKVGKVIPQAKIKAMQISDNRTQFAKDLRKVNNNDRERGLVLKKQNKTRAPGQREDRRANTNAILDRKAMQITGDANARMADHPLVKRLKNSGASSIDVLRMAKHQPSQFSASFDNITPAAKAGADTITKSANYVGNNLGGEKAWNASSNAAGRVYNTADSFAGKVANQTGQKIGQAAAGAGQAIQAGTSALFNRIKSQLGK